MSMCSLPGNSSSLTGCGCCPSQRPHCLALRRLTVPSPSPVSTAVGSASGNLQWTATPGGTSSDTSDSVSWRICQPSAKPTVSVGVLVLTGGHHTQGLGDAGPGGSQGHEGLNAWGWWLRKYRVYMLPMLWAISTTGPPAFSAISSIICCSARKICCIRPSTL
ncbi:hypothetical protein CRUP_008416 [Coryphaenoides rupestris]|nr:hypothetical protein CRUP_008416 [Coryphaenoides rupestris]